MPCAPTPSVTSSLPSHSLPPPHPPPLPPPRPPPPPLLPFLPLLPSPSSHSSPSPSLPSLPPRIPRFFDCSIQDFLCKLYWRVQPFLILINAINCPQSETVAFSSAFQEAPRRPRYPAVWRLVRASSPSRDYRQDVTITVAATHDTGRNPTA